MRWSMTWARGFVDRLELLVEGVDSEGDREKLRHLWTHRYTRFVRIITISTWRSVEIDVAWMAELLAESQPRRLEFLFISGPRAEFRADLSLFSRPGWLTTYISHTLFRGVFRNIRVLDLCHGHVQWELVGTGPLWPDLEVLILRRFAGNESDYKRWLSVILESPQAAPRLKELRLHDERPLDVVLMSPILPQLERLDLTDALTNRGAQLLHAHTERLLHLREILVGDTGDRRRVHQSMHRGNPGYEAPKRGLLEIDDGWRSRLKQRLGGRVRFGVPSSYR
jgi:hypothetical protein